MKTTSITLPACNENIGQITVDKENIAAKRLATFLMTKVPANIVRKALFEVPVGPFKESVIKFHNKYLKR